MADDLTLGFSINNTSGRVCMSFSGCQCDFPLGILVVGWITNVRNELFVELQVHMISNLRFTREKKKKLSTDDDDENNRIKRLKSTFKGECNLTSNEVSLFLSFVGSWHWVSASFYVYPLGCAWHIKQNLLHFIIFLRFYCINKLTKNSSPFVEWNGARMCVCVCIFSTRTSIETCKVDFARATTSYIKYME